MRIFVCIDVVACSPLVCGTIGSSCEKKRRFPVDSRGFGRRRRVASASSVKYWQSVEAIRLKCNRLRDRLDNLTTSGQSIKRKFFVWCISQLRKGDVLLL